MLLLCMILGLILLLTKKKLTADLLLYMEKDHLERIKALFPNTQLPKSINLDIPDGYTYMDPELIDILRNKIETIRKEDL